jgi:hypothetical protein
MCFVRVRACACARVRVRCAYVCFCVCACVYELVCVRACVWLCVGDCIFRRDGVDAVAGIQDLHPCRLAARRIPPVVDAALPLPPLQDQREPELALPCRARGRLPPRIVARVQRSHHRQPADRGVRHGVDRRQPPHRGDGPLRDGLGAVAHRCCQRRAEEFAHRPKRRPLPVPPRAPFCAPTGGVAPHWFCPFDLQSANVRRTQTLRNTKLLSCLLFFGAFNVGALFPATTETTRMLLFYSCVVVYFLYFVFKSRDGICS